MKKFLAEFIGTFALVFFGTGAMIIGEVAPGSISHASIAATWGLIVTAMIYAFGSTSGAHINPAVSIGFSMTNLFNKKLLIPYILAQLVGAILASVVLQLIFPSSKKLGASLPSGSWQESFVLEFFLSFMLMLAILLISQNEKTKKLTALVVGAVVGLEAFFAGPICGASMNPARSIGPAIISGNITHLWAYIVSTILGMMLATSLWINFNKKKS